MTGNAQGGKGGPDARDEQRRKNPPKSVDEGGQSRSFVDSDSDNLELQGQGMPGSNQDLSNQAQREREKAQREEEKARDGRKTIG